MPCGDGTGPVGRGPQTGRAAGYCAGFNRPGYMNRPAGGRGLALGFRGGRGRGRGRAAWSGYAQPTFEMTSEQEIDQLERRKEALKEELAALENRIAELKEEQKEN